MCLQELDEHRALSESIHSDQGYVIGLNKSRPLYRPSATAASPAIAAFFLAAACFIITAAVSSCSVSAATLAIAALLLLPLSVLLLLPLLFIDRTRQGTASFEFRSIVLSWCWCRHMHALFERFSAELMVLGFMSFTVWVRLASLPASLLSLPLSLSMPDFAYSFSDSLPMPDEIEGTQDQDLFLRSFSDSLSALPFRPIPFGLFHGVGECVHTKQRLKLKPLTASVRFIPVWNQLEWRIPLLDHASLRSHNHTLLITCTCCYHLTKGTQDKDFSYSFSNSLSVCLSLSLSHLCLGLSLSSAIGLYNSGPDPIFV